MNLGRASDRLDSVFHSSNKTDLSHWNGKLLIPMKEWIEIRDTHYALDYFPDHFNQMLTYISEDLISGLSYVILYIPLNYIWFKVETMTFGAVIHPDIRRVVQLTSDVIWHNIHINGDLILSIQ